MSTKVSFYEDVTDTKGNERFLSDIIRDIQNGKWEKQITELRSIQDEDAQKEYKNGLPCFTGSGVFKKRTTEGLVAHSGVLIIDTDLKDNPILLEKFDEIRQKLIADKHTHFLFTSCRGNGFAVGTKIDGAKPLEAFQFHEHYYREKHGLTIDKGCKDVTRLRFISYDPDLYLSEGAEIVIVPPDFMKEPKCSHTKPLSYANSENHENMRAIIASGKLLGDDSYESWLKIAFGLAHEFGETGRGYFHELSKISQKYDPVDCDRKFDNCIRTNRGHVTFASIVHLAKNAPEWSPDKVDKVDVHSSDENEVDILKEITESVLPITSFPIEAFPERFGQTIEKLSVSFNIDSEVSASIALSVIRRSQ